MTQNVGLIDRALRIFGGIALMVMAAGQTGAWLIVAGALGLVLLTTGILGWCAVYQLTGWNSLTDPSDGEDTGIENDL